MNALHLKSEREAMAMAKSKHIVSQSVEPAERPVSVKKIAIERIASITVKRASLAEYTITTATDIEAFRNRFPAAKFQWVGGVWQLFEAVGDLQSATIAIRA